MDIMNTQAIQFIGENGKMFRLPADATIKDLVTVFGVTSIRIAPLSYDELADGESAVTLQECDVCEKDVVSVNIHGQCADCEAKNENP